MAERENVPWYRDPSNTSPFALSKFLCSSKTSAFVSSAAFPWHLESLTTELFNGTTMENATLQSDWKTMIRRWSGSVAVGSTGCVYLLRKKGKPLYIKVPDQALPNNETAESIVRAVAWAVHPVTPTTPVLIIAASRSIFIYDLDSTSFIGKLRGHGGEITSIAVHPSWPYMFLTTSRDLSTRLYNLYFPPRQEPNNPHWPPNTEPSLAGPAWGMHSSESEGEGIGRCVGVLVGNRSGGHKAPVLHVAWHPTSDLIATCGMDRCVKIWRVPYVDYEKVRNNEEQLAREDKPLFSTDLIHKSRVLAIAWLNDDILVSCSAPALMRGDSIDDMYEEPGEIVVWQWLGFDRFLKQGQVQRIMRGCVSDYRNSESFKLLSVYALPFRTPSVHFFVPPGRTHDPILLVPDGKVIRAFNISQFKPRAPPDFPVDDENSQSVQNLFQKMQVVENPDDEEHEEDKDLEYVTYTRNRPERRLFDEIQSWTISAQAADDIHHGLPDIERCEMAWGGQAVIGVGNRGTFFLWKLNRPPNPAPN